MPDQLEVRPFKDLPFGAEIVGVDLRQPCSEHDLLQIAQAFFRFSVILFRDQEITPTDQIGFSRRFGKLEIHVQTNYLLPGHPEIFILSNIVENGRQIGGVDCALTWHSDSSYMAVPSIGSMLYGIECPDEGADTLFAGMYSPYDALPAAMRGAIEGRKAIHSYLRLQQHQFPERPLTCEQRTRTPQVLHPIAPTHPVTGRRSLFLGGDVIAGIAGMPEQEALDLMDELRVFATQDQFVYRHRWRVGDMLFWDNRCTLHRGTQFDKQKYRRRMHRTTLAGERAPAC